VKDSNRAFPVEPTRKRILRFSLREFQRVPLCQI
jgi:hypothetical protein